MGVVTLLGRRRRRPEEPVVVLLGDPATVRAAADALVHTERADEPAWPFVVAVGRESVTLHWAGLSAPAPHEPWRLGEDPRRWIADRAALSAAATRGLSSPVLVGRDEHAIVFVNTSRAPGPLTVEAAAGAPARDEVRAALDELVARQQPGGVGRGGAWWPLDVAGDAILLLGRPIATTLSVELARRAGELVAQDRILGQAEAAHAAVRATKPQGQALPHTQLVPARKAEPQPQPEPVDAAPQARATALAPLPAAQPMAQQPQPQPQPDPEPLDEDFEEWLRQVRMAVSGGATALRGNEPMRQALPAAATTATTTAAEQAPSPRVERGYRTDSGSGYPSGSVEDTAQIPKIVVEDQRGRGQDPDDGDDLDDWATDFAVSSAD